MPRRTGLGWLALFLVVAALRHAAAVQNADRHEEGVWFTGLHDITLPEPQFDARERLEACHGFVDESPGAANLIEWKDPLFVVWWPPMENSSFEHEWIEDVILAKVSRPVIYTYPVKCHLDFTYGDLIPKHVLYIIGAARAPDGFARCIERTKLLRQATVLSKEEKERATARIGLVHLSDEHIGYGHLCPKDDLVNRPISFIRCDSRIAILYPEFDYVLRNHWHPKLKLYGDKVRWFPLGHSTGYGKPARNSILPSSKRKFQCSFRGAAWDSRRDFIAAVANLSASGRLNCITSWSDNFAKGLPVTAFRKELMATVFAPTPPGLYNPDCFRIYEALYAGAIPIILRHYQFDPLGDHPLPMVDSWIEMGDVVARIEAEGVDAVQQRIYAWWHGFMDRLQTEVALIVA